MKGLSAVILITIAGSLVGCGPSKTAERIRALTPQDFERVHAAAVALCETYEPVLYRGEPDPFVNGELLFGADIPPALEFLDPQAVRYADSWLIVFLYKSPAGEDSITASRNDEGVWTIRTHIGSWKDRPSDVLWSSENR